MSSINDFVFKAKVLFHQYKVVPTIVNLGGAIFISRTVFFEFNFCQPATFILGSDLLTRAHNILLQITCSCHLRRKFGLLSPAM